MPSVTCLIPPQARYPNPEAYCDVSAMANSGTRTYNYKAARQQEQLTGRVWGGSGYFSTSVTNGFDGDGNRVKEVSAGIAVTLTTHYLRSTALGGAIVQEINSAPQTIGYVYLPSGELLTRLSGAPAWNHVTPVGTAKYETYQSGFAHRVEFDPAGATVSLTAPPPPGHFDADGDLVDHTGATIDSRYANLMNPAAGCVLDGVDAPCGLVDTLRRADGLAAESLGQSSQRKHYGSFQSSR